MGEAVSLAMALPGLKAAGSTIVPLPKPNPGHLFGKGKLEELKQLFHDQEIELVIIDGLVSPVQQRNLEKLWKVKLLDRTSLILEIFSDRAATREGVLQVEMAALSYQRTRLVRAWTHLERQRGGLGFVGGPGETQIEADRRAIDQQLVRLRRQLSKVVKTRSLHRAARAKVPFPVVALVGYTNAGKSTFLRAVSQARPRVAEYPFTTLHPELGVVDMGEQGGFVVADIPGLIEGAADGAGLGVKFLKHLERVQVLCHLIEPPIDELALSDEEGRIDGSRPLFRYRALRKELDNFSEELAWIPEVVVVTKMDLFEAELDGEDPKRHPEIAPLIDELHRENRALFFMSSVARDGLDPVKFALLKRIEAESPEAKEKKEKKAFDPLAKDKLR